MGDGELAAIEPVMAAEIRKESLHALAELAPILRPS